jgi:hypothetical protein
MSNLVTLGIAWIAGAVVVFIVGAAVWFVRELRTAPTEVEEVPLDDLLDDTTAAEADVFPHHGPAVVAQERALVAAIDDWMDTLDVEAWLGERGWL